MRSFEEFLSEGWFSKMFGRKTAPEQQEEPKYNHRGKVFDYFGQDGPGIRLGQDDYHRLDKSKMTPVGKQAHWDDKMQFAKENVLKAIQGFHQTIANYPTIKNNPKINAAATAFSEWIMKKLIEKASKLGVNYRTGDQPAPQGTLGTYTASGWKENQNWKSEINPDWKRDFFEKIKQTYINLFNNKIAKQVASSDKDVDQLFKRMMQHLKSVVEGMKVKNGQS